MSANEKKSYCLSIANTIWKSIFCSIPMPVAMSWGINKKAATLYDGMPGLVMEVNGLIHKGKVIVVYNEGTDYYEIYLIDKKHERVGSRENVCFDELGQILDEMIEKPKDMDYDAYKEKSWADSIQNIVNG